MPLLKGMNPRQIQEPGLHLKLLAQPEHGCAPVYRFAMRVPGYPQNAGLIELRLSEPDSLQFYGGQVGYGVCQEFRGRHLAARSLRLLIPLARSCGLERLWITCTVENLASRRSCEWAGAVLEEIVDLQPDHPRYLLGDRQMCRYSLELSGQAARWALR